MELPKKYNSKDIEAKWKQFWKENTVYVSSFQGSKVFSVDTPPPTVSGQMHMGHAFSYTQGDFIVRYKRMKGHTIFYPFGTDDNGLPTEHLVEKLKKVSSTRMSRSEFVALCEETIKEIKPEFIQAWIDLGISCDFENSYSTIDKQPTRVSQQSFLDLYEKELVYRKETPVTWCVKCQTAIAQADFENVEKESLFTDIAFHDADGKELVIATTRPELIPACVALAAHPDDERYHYLKGKTATVPLMNYEVPIIYDEDVAKDKGTGLMMVCTFGDAEDVEKWKKHDLDLRVIFEKYGKLNSLAGPYEGLTIKKAREQILVDLEEAKHVKAQKKIIHNTNTHDRCGTEIEFMKTPQWFVKVVEHKEKLLEAANKINWYPQHMKVRYDHWVENLNWDWTISRQRHFGVPFPLWYEKDTGNIVVARPEDLPIDPTETTPSWYEKDPSNLIAESDVMDTWATSSVTPQIALDWKGETSDEAFQAAFPMTLRMQAHDIIRTWAFYTIVKGVYNNDSIPWQNIMVSGFVLDPQGKKMSKSKGNTIDPIALTEKYGADVIRYAASVVKLGEDVPFQDKYLDTGKKLVTKIFNASKFAHMHLEDYDHTQAFNPEKITAIDKWIVGLLHSTIKEADQYLDKFEFAKARASIEKFFWTMCDYYLEIVKDRLYKPEIHGDDSRFAGQMTLSYILDACLKLFAPYVPFITDEVYSWKFSTGGSIHSESYPEFNEEYLFEREVKGGELAAEIIAFARKEKATAGVSQKHEVKKITIACTKDQNKSVNVMVNDIKMTVSAQEIIFADVPLTVGLEPNTDGTNIQDNFSVAGTMQLKIELAPKEAE